MKTKVLIFSTIWSMLLFTPTNQIYVPDAQTNKKPERNSPEIYLQMNHNYSRVYHQTDRNYKGSVRVLGEDPTSQRPYPVYRPSSARLTEVYVLNGTRIKKNANPTRQIVIYNKQRSLPPMQVFKTCPRNATGQFIYESSCNQFLNCWKGRGYVQNCSPGTLFNPKTLECDFPEKVTCVSGPRETILQSERSYRSVKQVGCPKEFSGLIPNYTDCSKFINCVSGIENLMDCPPGTLFDINKNICDFAHKATCFNGHKVKKSIDVHGGESQQLRYKSSNQIVCPYGVEGLHKHPHDCSKFLNCANGQTYVQQCSPGTLFNPAIKICDFPYNVRCENSTGYGGGVVDYDAGKSVQYYGQEQQNSFNSYGTEQPVSNYHNNKQVTDTYYNQGGLYNEERTNDNRQYHQSSVNRGQQGQDGFYTNSRQYLGESDQNHNVPYGTNSYDSSISQYAPYSTTQRNTYYDTSTNRYGSVSNGHGYGPYDSSINNQYPQTSYNPSQRPDTQAFYNQNQYVKGSRAQQSGSYGSQYHNPQNTYRENPGSYIQTHYQKGSYDQNYNQNAYQQPFPKGSYSHTYDQTSYQQPIQTGSVSSYDQNAYHQPTHKSTVVSWDPNYNQQPFQGNTNHLYDHGSTSTNYNNRGQETHHPSQNNWSSGNYNPGGSSYNTNRYPYDSSTPTNQRNDHNYPIFHRNRTYLNQYPQTTHHNPWQETTNYESPETITPNYDRVVNINFHRPTTRIPFRDSHRPTTTNPRSSSRFSDYDDYVPGYSSKLPRATTQKTPKHWPPPFPSTDVNADYVFEYDDNEGVTLEAENNVKFDQECSKSDFRCSNSKCISKSLVCDGHKNCDDGSDETKCLDYLANFAVKKEHKIAILEKERWNNVSIAACALLCAQTKRFQCRSFNYRKIDKTCFLTSTNEQMTGALIAYYPIDYYELIKEQVDCSRMYVCENKKCIDKSKICDGHDDCGDRMDEKNCRSQDFGYSVQLTGSKDRHQGLVEVTAFGKTGYVCDDKFGLRDANVVCKELGFHLGAAEVKGNSHFFKNITDGEVLYMMDDVTCSGNETKLMDCDFNGWGVHNCLGQEMVGVVCKTPQEKCPSDYWQCDSSQECLPLAFVCDGLLDCSDGSDEGSQHCDAPTQIRLVNGSNRQEGRIEISHHGIWGTVCDDDFNEDAAKVVCKQLGYVGAAVVKKEAYFGSGSGPIWLDQVFCSGNESKVEECTHWNWGEHNCEHSEDVGVICSNSNRNEYVERHSMALPQMAHNVQIYPDRCGYRNDKIFGFDDDVHFRVVKGSVAKRGDYPWQAAIRVKGKTSTTHWCGAVVISEKFVLTAAHCLIGYSKGAYVVIAGDYNVDEIEGSEQEANIEDFYLHEGFRQGHKMNNDIALIKLKGRGFRLTDDVQAICLPEEYTSYETGQNCTISGFGSIESGKSAFSHNLRAGWIPLQKREICTMPHVYGDALTDGMVCAGSLDEGVDACDGDSGGPLACLNQGVYTLYGITSWGQHCGYANKPGVYVKVAHYRKWIDDNLRKHA